MEHVRILRLNKAGNPLGWLSKEQAATLMCLDRIVWSHGAEIINIYGGTRMDGERSVLHLPSIVATKGDHLDRFYATPGVNNWLLFRRDKCICLYCGERFRASELTCDHVIPKMQGGQDIWMNVVAACYRCNHRKGGRTPDEANMPLLAVPFRPNPMEALVLQNRYILADQMEFLSAGFSRNMRPI